MTTLSRKARHALRALYALAAHADRGPLLIADLAEQEKLPRKFLEAILLELKNGASSRARGQGGRLCPGPSGGADPDRQVIRIIDGPLAPIPCVSEKAYVRCEECEDEGPAAPA